ncbi:hypothetical protein HDU84_005332 [Entophlyctis sp. JEL0112]|nr:hypothetical protein HDU84_005332 [Entophlyctis sp. JEL0112]
MIPTPSSTADASDEVDDFDTVESPFRYLGLVGRLRNVVIAQSRLLAYTSEVGEAFRPIASPIFVTGAYAVSWAYVIGDVGFESYKMRRHGASDVDVARTAVERGIFQSLASMVLPAFTVHWIVHQTAGFFKNKTGLLKRFGPSACGLSTIPLLPLIFDKPVEHATEFVFDTVWPLSAKGQEVKAQIHAHAHAHAKDQKKAE